MRKENSLLLKFVLRKPKRLQTWSCRVSFCLLRLSLRWKRMPRDLRLIPLMDSISIRVKQLKYYTFKPKHRASKGRTMKKSEIF